MHIQCMRTQLKRKRNWNQQSFLSIFLLKEQWRHKKLFKKLNNFKQFCRNEKKSASHKNHTLASFLCVLLRWFFVVNSFRNWGAFRVRFPSRMILSNNFWFVKSFFLLSNGHIFEWCWSEMSLIWVNRLSFRLLHI